MCQIESYLMRSIISRYLPNGLLSDEDISGMPKEEKEKLFQIQKQIIREFQQQAEQEICALNVNLRILNDHLFDLRKKKAPRNLTETQNPEIILNRKPEKDKNIKYPTREPYKSSHSTRNPRIKATIPIVSVPRKPRENKSTRPPFHH